MKTNIDLYNYYKKVSENPVKILKFMRVLNTYNRYCIDKVIEGNEIVLPLMIGTLKINGRKERPIIDKVTGQVKGMSINWKDTKKLWETDEEAKMKKTLMYNMNHNTDGVIYRFYWSVKGILMKNKYLYSLTVCREAKRRLWKEIEGGKSYIVRI